jgi:transcriptional regulator with XRE-family HTH domain
MKKLNLVWRQVVWLRRANGWTQDRLCRQLQLAGWHNATRSTVSKIEGGSIGIADFDVLFVAAALRVQHSPLFPQLTGNARWMKPSTNTFPRNCTIFAPESEPT